MATTRREFLRASMVTGLAAAAASLPAVRALAAEPMVEGYQVPKDPANLTPLEMAHWPKLTVREARDGGASRLMVQVGKEVHPMLPEHHIEWIEVWNGKTKLARTDLLEPTALKPIVSFSLTVPAGTELTVKINCNLHGLWGNTVKV